MLDLKAYANYLRRGRGWLFQTLRELRMELHAPYEGFERRGTRGAAEVALLTGENGTHAVPGEDRAGDSEEAGSPAPRCDGRPTGYVLVQLDSGVTGMIAKEDLADSRWSAWSTRLRLGR